jgi:NADH-quinone oxidoreductase subunit L
MQLPFSPSLKRLEHWLEPSLFGNEVHLSVATSTMWILALVAIAGGIAGITLAIAAYQKRKVDYTMFERPILAEAWQVDRRVSDFMGGPGTAGFEATAGFDQRVVDGAVNGTGRLVQRLAQGVRRFQNGLVRTYAAGIGVGAVLLLLWFFMRSGI